MDIKIDEAALTGVVQAAILEQLGDDGRKLLIAAALDYLLKDQPNKNASFNQPKTFPSPLQTAFNEAVAKAPRQIVADEVATDEAFIERIRVIVGEARMAFETENYKNIVVEALAAGWKKDPY